MRAHPSTTRLLASLTIVFLVSGCAAGASSTPLATSATPTSTPSAAAATPAAVGSPSITPAASGPVAYGPVTEITGTGTCPTTDLGKSTTDAAGVTHYRGGTLNCTVTTNDPRVGGTAPASSWNMDLWGTLEDGAVVLWGTSHLENAGGAWEGTGSGVSSSDRGDIIAFWYKGTGGYAGLSYFALWTGKDPWTIRGQVFPGDPPNLAAMPTRPPTTPLPTVAASPTASPSALPTAIAYGPVSVVTGTHAFTTKDPGMSTAGPGDVTSYRNGTFTGIDTANDPRVSFTWTGSPWAMDIWGTFAEGAGIEWGLDRGENAGGAWECSGSGIFSSDRADTIVIWCKGTGGYAGLAYFELITASDPFALISSDEANRIVHGQIFPGNPPTP